MLARLPRLLLLIVVALATVRLGATEEGFEEVMVPTRDGTQLRTRIWKPAKPGAHPVVFSRGRTPGFSQDHRRFTDAGYVYVGQASRGDDATKEGLFTHDADDGYDALTWISQQPWCDGNIAMYGKSYWATTQWLVAGLGHPNLKAIIPQNVNADLFQYAYRANGALTLALTATGRATVGRQPLVDWETFLRSLPLKDLDLIGSGRENRLWNDYVKHATFDDFWRPVSLRSDGADGKYSRIRIPVYLHGGWFDYYAGATLTSYRLLREAHPGAEIRVIVSAGDHMNRAPVGRAFPGGGKDEIALAIRWLDQVVRGIDTGVDREPPVRLFVMGSNEWRSEHEWPLARTRFTRYFLHNPDGDRFGTLDPEPPVGEASTEYVYDPADPCPTIAGSHSFMTDLPGLIQAGSVDQRANENRADVLVFSTPGLAEDTEVIGPVVVELFASSSARDTDFTVKLLDVAPDGAAYNLTEGILRASYRRSVWEEPEPLVPGEIYRFRIEMQPTANVFRQGHRIRLHVSSSSWPLWDRNPNTGNPPGEDAELLPARQRVHHDRLHPSCLILPVIPASGTVAPARD